jgi:hypothetical protein
MLCDSMMPAPALPAMGEALAILVHELRDPLASIVLAELHPARRPMRKVTSVYGGNRTFFGQIVRPRCSDNSCGNRSASVCRGIGNEAILALPSGCRASKWLLNSEANPGIRARAKSESLIGEFSGSRCDRIFLNAAVWSEDVQRPARRGNGSPDFSLVLFRSPPRWTDSGIAEFQ